MIISRIDGGLGNQMFQYAYAYYLASKHNAPLMLDTGSYDAQPQHGYLLNHFNISASLLPNTEQHRLPRRYRSTSYKNTRTLVQRLLPLSVLRRHKQTEFGFSSRHLSVPNHCYLVGYWQSQKFFPGLREELLKQFQPREPISEVTQRVLDRIQSTNSVAVHVRRGDYVTNSEAAKIYCHLPTCYYTDAISDWAASQVQPEVFVFSNDIAWCQHELQLPYPVTFVDHNTNANAHEDMVLMSHAKCCVIANSTFSWWGAWLNQRDDCTIYAPDRWFQSGTLDGSDIVPENWQRLSSNVSQHLKAA